MTDHDPKPFGASMAWLLDNPLTRFGARRMVRRLPVAPGMRVVDLGCGPGRLTLPLARAVGGAGEVVAADLQPAMLERVARRAAGDGLTNVRTLRWTAGDGTLPTDHFDLGLLIAVLGEIPAARRPAAMAEIAAALTAGGTLVVVEGMMDPHRQSIEAVRALAEPAGLALTGEHRRPMTRLITLRRPATARPHSSR